MIVPVISVIIPTYNRAHVLQRALDSVLRQTLREIEVLVVDDASVDSTRDIVSASKDLRIRYIRHENKKGASAARNTGVAAARGEYIGFLDSDDEWFPDKLEKQMNLFNSSPQSLGLVYTACVEVEDSKQKRVVMPTCRGNVMDQILVKNCVGYIVTPLVRKECFVKAGLFDENMPGSQDWDMWIRIARYYEVDFVDEILVTVYPQGDGIMKNARGAVMAHKMILHKYENLVKSLPKGMRAERYFREGIFFWWKREIGSSLRYLAKSVVLDPTKSLEIVGYVVTKVRQKVLAGRSRLRLRL